MRRIRLMQAGACCLALLMQAGASAAEPDGSAAKPASEGQAATPTVRTLHAGAASPAGAATAVAIPGATAIAAPAAAPGAAPMSGASSPASTRSVPAAASAGEAGGARSILNSKAAEPKR